jgi:ATP-binding cassette, subfamily C, bacterial CydCD
VTAPPFSARRRAVRWVDLRLGKAGRPARRAVTLAAVAGVGQSAAVVVQAVLLADVIERALFHRATLSSLGPQLVGLAIAIAARGGLGWAAGSVAAHSATGLGAGLRRRLLSHMLALGPSWATGERAGELALTATGGVDAVGVYVGRYLPQLAVAVLAPIGVLAWVGATDWISLLILLGLLVMVPPAMVVFGRRAAEAASRQWRGLSSLSAHLLEMIQGLPTLRAFGRVDYGRREVAEATEGLRRATIRTLRVALLSSLSLELLAGLGTGLVAMVLGLRLLDGHTSLSVALAVLLVSPEVFLPLRRASAEFHASAEGVAAAERIATVLGRPLPEPPDAPRVALPDLAAAPVSLESVSVEFPDRTAQALAPLSLRIGAGRRVALIGPSGSGKSTALHAIAGLVPISSGRILLGDVDLRAVDQAEWRRHISWVPQRPHLFAGTIGENVRLGRPDAADSAVAAAVSAAGLDEVLFRLPRGLETIVGEGGATLSSGERQRVAIARAVLHDGRLVLLDELGSHLDPDARAALAASLDLWLDGRTVLFAAHDLVPLGHLDEVVDLGAGSPGVPVVTR